MKGIYFTEQQKRYIIENYQTMRSADIAKEIGCAATSVVNFANRNGIKKPQGFFAKCNKERVMTKEHLEKLSKTWFGNGRVPKNHKPIGSERLEKDGWVIKIAEHNVWISKARHIWHQHNGAIPEGYKIIFKDKNCNNLSIDNLEMIATGNLMLKNSKQPLQDDLILNTRRLVNKLSKAIKENE